MAIEDRQYQAPRIPQNWSGQEKKFAQAMLDVLDDIYYRYGRLGLNDLSKDARKVISDTQGNIVELQTTTEGIMTRVQSAEGDISTLEQTASGLTTRLTNAEGDISTLEQTATSLSARVTDAEGYAAQAILTANEAVVEVGKLPFVNPNMLLAADTDVANTGYPTIRYDPYVDAVTGQEAALVVGEQYTFTVRLQTQSAAAGNVMLYTSGGYVQLVSIPLYSEGTAWATYRGTFTFNGYGTQQPEDHQLRVYCTPQGRPVRIQWAKLEKGDHATDFCLSPAEMKNSGISIKPDSLNIYSSGTMNIASDGKMVIESGAEGCINLNDGSIFAKNLNAQELTVGGKQVGVNAFMLSLPAVFTQGASSAPAGHNFLWFNASGGSITSASRSGSTSVGYLPRTYTLEAPDNTMANGTFTYTLRFGVTNRQNSNPDTITVTVTATINGVVFSSGSLTIRRWETKNVVVTVTSSVNLFASAGTLSVDFTQAHFGAGLGADLDGSTMTLTASKSGTSGTQSVTVQYVP